MKQNIKRFQIKNLFRYMDVDLPLEEDVNIFLGENGLGKTTILNCLYNIMTLRFEKLRDVVFDSIIITFTDNKEYEINYNDVLEYNSFFEDNKYLDRFQRLDRYFSEKEKLELKNNILKDSDYNIEQYIYRISDAFRIPPRIAKIELKRYIHFTLLKTDKGNIKNVEKIKKKIEEEFSDKIMYFPTYRRIEEDLSKLDIDIDREYENIKPKLIHFGMKDVNLSIKKTLEKIRELAIDSFTEMTGILLTQYLSSQNINTKPKSIDVEKLRIVLDRVGDKINQDDKNQIIDMVNTNKIYENIYLGNLLNNLIQSYEKQSLYDEKIKRFVDVCNKYLVQKHFKYDESDLKLNLYNDRNDEIINIDNLSSGEKQLISIFSKLYLDNNESSIILFDEPELSLSIEWQATLLPDIMKSEKCSKLIVVTHSPFIFENEYDLIARDMGNCLKYNMKY